MAKYEKSPPARFTVREWYRVYQSRGSNVHRGGYGRPKISSTVRNEIRKLFENDPRMSLSKVASDKSVVHAKFWNIFL